MYIVDDKLLWKSDGTNKGAMALTDTLQFMTELSPETKVRIEVTSKGLFFDTTGTLAIKKNDDTTNTLLWTKGDENKQGYFSLEDQPNNKFITADTSNGFMVLGK